MQLKHCNYVAFSRFHGTDVNNLGLLIVTLFLSLFFIVFSNYYSLLHIVHLLINEFIYGFFIVVFFFIYITLWFALSVLPVSFSCNLHFIPTTV